MGWKHRALDSSCITGNSHISCSCKTKQALLQYKIVQSSHVTIEVNAHGYHSGKKKQKKEIQLAGKM